MSIRVQARYPPCSLCTDQPAPGDVTFRHEARSAEQLWVHLATRESAPLCPECYGWFQSVMQAAANPDPRRRPPGAPWVGGASGLDSRRCDFCHGTVAHDAFVVDFVPAAEEEMRARITAYSGAVCQYRLCEGCWTWARSVLEDDAGVTAAGSRAQEGSAGSWLVGHRFDIAATGLLPEDLALIARVQESTGRRLTVLSRIEAHTYRPGPSELLVVGTTGGATATRLLSRLPAGARERAAIVARSDGAEDASGALRAGAGDFLVSPLSPQQVVGAFERYAVRPSGSPRDAATGLPGRRAAGGRFGHPGNVLRLPRVPQSDVMSTAWLLRRFLRGYDDVAIHEERILEAVVYCPEDAAPAVARRMGGLLGSGAPLAVVERLPVQAHGGRLRRAA